MQKTRLYRFDFTYSMGQRMRTSFTLESMSAKHFSPYELAEELQREKLVSLFCFRAFLENIEMCLFEVGKDMTSNFCVFKLRIHRRPAVCSPTHPGKMVWTKCPRPVKRVPRRPVPPPWPHPAVPPPRPVAKSPHR